MLFMGRELFDRQTAFGACVLFQCFPSSSQVFADGLCEALYLLFAASALWLAVRGLRTRAVWPFALCGAFAGLAYLTRPEGALTVGAAGLVLLGCQAVPAWRRSWRTVLACGLCLACTFLAVAGPYIATIGRLTVKPTAQAIVDGSMAEAGDQPAASSSGNGPLLATVVVGQSGEDLRRGWRSGWEVGKE